MCSAELSSINYTLDDDPFMQNSPSQEPLQLHQLFKLHTYKPSLGFALMGTEKAALWCSLTAYFIYVMKYVKYKYDISI